MSYLVTCSGVWIWIVTELAFLLFLSGYNKLKNISRCGNLHGIKRLEEYVKFWRLMIEKEVNFWRTKDRKNKRTG